MAELFWGFSPLFRVKFARSCLWLSVLKLLALVVLISLSSSDTYAASHESADYLEVQKSDFWVFIGDPCPDGFGRFLGPILLCYSDLGEEFEKVLVKLEEIDQSPLFVDEEKLTRILEVLKVEGVGYQVLLPDEVSSKIQAKSFVKREFVRYEVAGVVTCVCYAIIAICSVVNCP